MLIDTDKVHQFYIVCGKTDLRRGIDGLAAVIQQQFELDPTINRCTYFVVLGRTDSKRCIGMVMAFFFYTKELRTDDSNGQSIKMRFES